jgi:uncharacterized membrane protein
MTTAGIVIYLVIAKIFFVLTLVEGIMRNMPWTAARFSGLALSAAWPLIVIAAAFFSRRRPGKAA